MRTLPPEPKPGDKISATLIREIIRAIRERTVLQGPGVKTSVGPNGTVLSVDPSAKKTSAAILPQCFDLKTGDDETKLVNCYYSIGGVTYGSAEMEIEINAGSILALKVDVSSTPSVSIAKYASIYALNQAQQNKMYYIRPLYWFDANSSVKLDFRNMPDLSPWEFE